MEIIVELNREQSMVQLTPKLKTGTMIGSACIAWFVASAGIILIVAGIAKIMSAFGHARMLAMTDPIVGIQFQRLLLVIGVAEVIVGGICFFCINRFQSVGSVAWMATCFLVYRINLWQIGWHRPCACMGNLTDALHIPPQTADTAMKIILAYLLLGSYATLFWLWRQRKMAGSSAVGAASL